MKILYSEKMTIKINLEIDEKVAFKIVLFSILIFWLAVNLLIIVMKYIILWSSKRMPGIMEI